MNDTQVFTFSNVHLKLYDKKNHRLIREVHKKNTITKYALNGIASMLKGEFNNSNYIKIDKYVPKYLALGTNMPSDDTTITVHQYVTVNDDSLYGEILKNDKPRRIRLEQAKRIDNSVTNEYVKLRFRTLVMSGVVSYNAVIQELGLFVDNTDIKGGLFARIATEPITIPENSVLDVQWDIVLTSSTGVYPTSIYLLDDNNILVPYDNDYKNISYSNIVPFTANLKSSTIDWEETTTVKAQYIYYPENDWKQESDIYLRCSTNNFNDSIKYARIEKNQNNENKYDLYLWDSVNLSESETSDLPKETSSPNETFYNTFDNIDSAKNEVVNMGLLLSTDINGNIINSGTDANKYVYKNVTYANCVWNLYYDDNLIKEYKSSETYSVNDVVSYNDSVYKCKTAVENPESFDETKWYKIMTYIKYMVNIVIINYNESGEDFDFVLEVVTATNISTRGNIKLTPSSQN